LVEKCSYCGEEGHSIQNCPKWKAKEASKKSARSEAWREAIVTEFEMDKLFRFQYDVDYAEWERLYLAVGGTKNMAQHLWGKFHEYDHQILKLWADLDSEQRPLILAMISKWKGLPLTKLKKWRVWFTTPMGFERFVDVETATEEEAKTKASAQVPAGSEHRYTAPQE